MSFPAIARCAPSRGAAHAGRVTPTTHATYAGRAGHVSLAARVGLRVGLHAAAALLVCALGACAAPWQRFTPGEDASRVTAALGCPQEIYALPDGTHRWFWPTRPFGETTTAADVDAAGKLVSIRQVLTNASFAQAVVGTWTREDVQRHFGLPEETAYYPLMKRAVWSYRYMDDDVWYMLYHFYFDDAGIVRSTQKTPDPLHDPDRHFGNF